MTKSSSRKREQRKQWEENYQTHTHTHTQQFAEIKGHETINLKDLLSQKMNFKTNP